MSDLAICLRACAGQIPYRAMRFQLLTVLASVVLSSIAVAQPTQPARPPVTGHPRLYFTRDDLPRLRQLRSTGVHQQVWENIRASADWALTHKPRHEWIAPITPDPIY